MTLITLGIDMKNLLKLAVASFALMFFSGCASVAKMPLNKDTAVLDLSKKSVLVARLKIKNENHPSHQPKLLAVFMNQTVAGKDEQFSFTSPTMVSDQGEQGIDYLISMDVEPGKATLNMARFLRQIPLLLMAMADLPFKFEVDVPANKVVYLGNIEATIVARANDTQPRAGSVLPLIDQAVAGFSNGTFQLKISDQFDSDSQEMQKQFPALAGKTIDKQVLPAWVHPELRTAAAATVAAAPAPAPVAAITEAK